MAELQRNQRGEIGHQHVKQVKVHSCSHFGSYFDQTSPTQSDDNTSQIDNDVGAYVPYSFRTMWRVLLRLLPTELQGWRRQDQRLNVTAQWCDHLNWASVISPVFLRPWLMVRPGFELATSRSADRRFSNWANRAAVCFINLSLFIHAKYTLNYAFIILVGQWNKKKIVNEDKGERNSRISAAGYPKRNPVSIT